MTIRRLEGLMGRPIGAHFETVEKITIALSAQDSSLFANPNPGGLGSAPIPHLRRARYVAASGSVLTLGRLVFQRSIGAMVRAPVLIGESLCRFLVNSWGYLDAVSIT